MPAIERPKAKRLRPGRAHRTALLESLPEEQRRIAEQVVLGGLPAVRQAIEKQNAERTAAGESAIASGPLLELAEKLVPRVRAAEWRDRAEAALGDMEHLDLRDLRSVVSAADPRTKDPEARELAEKLQSGLVGRVDAEHAAWLEELTATLDVGRIVRALRVSSRPPKAGAPLPAELSARLTTMAGEALTADAAAERWVAVLDALAFSPVRDKVIPASLPVDLHADVRGTIARLATRIPKVAHIFEIEPDPNAPRPKPERRRPAKPKKAKPEGGQAKDRPKKDRPRKDRPPKDQAAPEGAAAAETASAPTADAPEAEAPPVEASVAEAPPVEASVAEDSAASGADDATITASEQVPAPGVEDAQPAPPLAPPVPPPDDDVWVAESSLEEEPARGPAPPDAAPTAG